MKPATYFPPVVSTVLILVAAVGFADDAAVAMFEKDIRPLLHDRCVECHGREKQEGGLRLDLPGFIQQGGSSGNAIVAKAPERSLLFQAIEYKDEALQMPPAPKPRLTAQQVALVRRWIEAGAPFPEGGAPTPIKQIDSQQIEQGRRFWAFQSPKRPVLVEVPNPENSVGPIDRFLEVSQRERGLAWQTSADRHTWIRRATLDLTGLPPTPDEVTAFIADDSPDAQSRAVDRLLASPRYGEHWGRHWLDVARYADSNGLDENVAFGNAWRYRDYVVNAWNDDRPFDQFVVEQLAGDLLQDGVELNSTPDKPVSPRRRELLIATGYLSLGPKVLAEVDERKMEMDIVDEQIDTIGKGLMGMTLGCARCHDHKFDPFSTADYYAMAGIFKSTRTMENFKKVARWNEVPIPSAEELELKHSHDHFVEVKKKAIDDFVRNATEKLNREASKTDAANTSQPNSGSAPDANKVATQPKDIESRFSPETKSELKKLRDELKELEAKAPEMSTAMGVSDGSVADVPIHVRGSHLTLGKTVERRVPQVFTSANATAVSADTSGRLQFAKWLVSPDHPLTSRVFVNRLWRWHFGRGIVDSADNFGSLGSRPTNAPLLDWLATDFVENSWSIKRVHRQMMLTRAYGLSSDFSKTAGDADPDNRLLSRFEIRRLEAESIRDSLLAVSGLLDETIGGSLLQVKNRAYFFDHTSTDKTNYDVLRRSLYLPVVRNNMYDVFQLFDYTDASVLNGDRDSTVVAPQALFMMNSGLIIRCAKELGANLLREYDNDDSRVDALYFRSYGRPATAAEIQISKQYLSQFTGAQFTGAQFTGTNSSANGDSNEVALNSWTLLCQSVLAANEFLYVR